MDYRVAAFPRDPSIVPAFVGETLSIVAIRASVVRYLTEDLAGGRNSFLSCDCTHKGYPSLLFT